MAKIKNRTGEENINKFGRKMWIKEYRNAIDIDVEFEDGYCLKTTYQNFKNKEVFNPYDKSVFGIGYIGEGKFKTCIDNIMVKQYKSWNHMMERCYNVLPREISYI